MPRSKTYCKRGHARTPENLTKRGSCRTCDRERRNKNRRLWGAKHPFQMPKKERCKHGHLLTAATVLFNRRGGYAGCRTCKNLTKLRSGHGKETELRPGELEKIVKIVSAGGHLGMIEPGFNKSRRWRTFRLINPKAGNAIRKRILRTNIERAWLTRRAPAQLSPAVDRRELDTAGYRAVLEACTRLPAVMREEIQQDMMVAAIENRFDPMQARDHLQLFVRRWRREHRFDIGERRGNYSLDAPAALGTNRYDLIGENRGLWSTDST